MYIVIVVTSDVQLSAVNYDALKEICAIRGLGSPYVAFLILSAFCIKLL